MITLKEKKLDEMAIQVVSSQSDGLPFRIAIKAPDHLPPHAHVMDSATGKKELGQFLLSSDLPKKPEDIKDYKQGIPDEWRPLILQWAKNRCADFPVAKNWEMLYWEWKRNEKW
jgi:hypothetical protein